MRGSRFRDVSACCVGGTFLVASTLFVGGMVLLGCAETMGPASGWGVTDLPDTYPAQADVLEAAKGVIGERYRLSSASTEGGFVYALGPVVMDGGSKTRKQISVYALRNFTGAFEPVVRVRQYVEVGSPELKVQPESASSSRAAPIAGNQWHALDNLPYEEQAIYDAILQRLAKKDAPPAQSS